MTASSRGCGEFVYHPMLNQAALSQLTEKRYFISSWTKLDKQNILYHISICWCCSWCWCRLANWQVSRWVKMLPTLLDWGISRRKLHQKVTLLPSVTMLLVQWWKFLILLVSRHHWKARRCNYYWYVSNGSRL